MNLVINHEFSWIFGLIMNLVINHEFSWIYCIVLYLLRLPLQHKAGVNGGPNKIQ